MLNSKKGQLFDIILAIFTVILLGMALYFIAVKPAFFGHTIGTQQYSTIKLYHANEKYVNFYEKLALKQLRLSIKETVYEVPPNCEEFEGYTYVIKDDKKCNFNFINRIQDKFNAKFTGKFSQYLNEKEIYSVNQKPKR